MHSFVPLTFVAFIAVAQAGVLISPGIVQYPAFKTVYSSPVITKTFYSSPVQSVQTDEATYNGRTGSIYTKKVSSQPKIVQYSGATAVHPSFVSYAVAPSPHYVAPTVITKGVKYVPSAIGLVPEGSGLEGQYVPDHSEKFFDDGSYRPEHH